MNWKSKEEVRAYNAKYLSEPRERMRTLHRGWQRRHRGSHIKANFSIPVKPLSIVKEENYSIPVLPLSIAKWQEVVIKCLKED